MLPLQLLLGANIIGIIVLVGPYVYVFVCLTVGCLNRTYLKKRFNWAFILFPCCHCVAAEPVPETQPTVLYGPPPPYCDPVGVPPSYCDPVGVPPLYGVPASDKDPILDGVPASDGDHTPELQEVSIV